jgi:hypothetical protein
MRKLSVTKSELKMLVGFLGDIGINICFVVTVAGALVLLVFVGIILSMYI